MHLKALVVVLCFLQVYGQLGSGSWPRVNCDNQNTARTKSSVGKISHASATWILTFEHYDELEGSVLSDDGGVLYFTTRKDGYQTVIGLNTASGEQTFNSPKELATESPINSPVVTAYKTLLISSDLFMHSFSATSRKELWRFPLQNETATGSPVVTVMNDILFATQEGSIVSLWGNGTLKWKKHFDHITFYEYPTLSEDEETLYVSSVTSGVASITAVSVRDGSLVWEWKAPESYTTCLPPAFNDGYLFVSCEGPELQVYYGGISPNGTTTWVVLPFGSISVKASPSVGLDGSLFFGSVDPDQESKGYMFNIHRDGEMKWTRGGFWGIYSSPAIDADGTLFVAWKDMKAVNPKDGSLVWTSDSPALGLGERQVTALDHSRMYLTGPKTIMALRFYYQDEDAWEMWQIVLAILGGVATAVCVISATAGAIIIFRRRRKLRGYSRIQNSEGELE